MEVDWIHLAWLGSSGGF